MTVLLWLLLAIGCAWYLKCGHDLLQYWEAARWPPPTGRGRENFLWGIRVPILFWWVGAAGIVALIWTVPVWPALAPIVLITYVAEILRRNAHNVVLWIATDQPIDPPVSPPTA